MNPRIDGNTPGHIAAGFGDSASANLANPQTGTWRGEQAITKDASSVLADAAEEMGMVAAESHGDKTHAQLKIKAGGRARAMTAAEVTNYLHKCKSGADEAKLQSLAQKMLKEFAANPRGFNPGELARQHSDGGTSGQAGDTATQQYAVLQFAAEFARSHGAPPQALDAIDDALLDLEEAFGHRIRADFNSIDAAVAFDPTPSGIVTFQRTYSDLVTRQTLAETLPEVLKHLAGRVGERLEKGIEQLIEAAGQELSATMRSAPVEQLNSFVDRLKMLVRMNTVHQGCKELLREVFTMKAQGA